MGEDQALARLRDILASPAYQVDRAQPWWEQVLAPVFNLIDYLLARLLETLTDTTSGREGWFGVGALVLCLALFVVVGAYLIRMVRLSVVRESGIGRATLAERRERSERLWRTAHQLAAAGQLADAVRVLYLSALYALDERDLLHVETGLTNREHARRLSRTHPALGETFFEVVERYDRLRYGRFPVTQTAFADLSGLVARARTASLQGSSA